MPGIKIQQVLIENVHLLWSNWHTSLGKYIENGSIKILTLHIIETLLHINERTNIISGTRKGQFHAKVRSLNDEAKCLSSKVRMYMSVCVYCCRRVLIITIKHTGLH